MTAVNTLRGSLARTALLVQRDFFPSLSEIEIADSLAELNVRIVADAENLGAPAAQTAVVAIAIVLAQSGAGVDLNIPDVEPAGLQPPLRASTSGLAVALSAHLDRLPAQRVERPGFNQPDLVIAIGDTPLEQSS